MKNYKVKQKTPLLIWERQENYDLIHNNGNLIYTNLSPTNSNFSERDIFLVGKKWDLCNSKPLLNGNFYNVITEWGDSVNEEHLFLYDYVIIIL